MRPVYRSLASVFVMCFGVSIGAAELRIVLLDSKNQPLGHGEATVIAKSPKHGWTRYVGFYRNGRYYGADLPSVDYLNVFIYTTADTRQKIIQGIYGRRSHTLHLRTDHVGYAKCSEASTAWAMPYDLFDLVQDLDAAFPDGVPKKMTNIRAQLHRTVLPALNNSPEPEDPELAREKEAFRRRVMKHLR